jgi:hypothetical protein
MAISPSSLYSASDLAELAGQTEYEAWFLEAVYEITDDAIAAKEVYEAVYPPGASAPSWHVRLSIKARIGDWRSGFLSAGAPLVFVTAFKLLDMLMEWVLGHNGKSSSFRFEQKIAHAKGGVAFPSLIEGRPWLRERLIALYERLEPLRGTVIHARHFTTNNGALEVASSKRGVIGPLVSISAAEIRMFGAVLVSVLHFLHGSWPLDAFREKRLRRAFDSLAALHGLPSLGQLSPGYANVRVYVLEADSLEIDLAKLHADVKARSPSEDMMFDLRIVVVANDGKSAQAFLVPWEELQAPVLRTSLKDLSRYTSTVPTDVDPRTLAAALTSFRERQHR